MKKSIGLRPRRPVKDDFDRLRDFVNAEHDAGRITDEELGQVVDMLGNPFSNAYGVSEEVVKKLVEGLTDSGPGYSNDKLFPKIRTQAAFQAKKLLLTLHPEMQDRVPQLGAGRELS